MKRRNLAKTFREYAEYRYPGYAGEAVPCDNCGRVIRTLKFENVSHRVKRSRDKSKAHDFGNLDILCGPMDFVGGKDESCHSRYERGEIKLKDQKLK